MMKRLLILVALLLWAGPAQAAIIFEDSFEGANPDASGWTWSGGFCGSMSPSPTADPNATTTTQTLLGYLTALPSQPNHRLISGQWYAVAEPSHISNVFTLTGQYPGLVGDNNKRPSLASSMIAYAQQGSIVQIETYLHNPETGGSVVDTTLTSLAAVYTPGNAVYDNFLAQLDVIAAKLQTLQDADVPVLWRPLPEQNGNWFWWNANGTNAQYIELWQYVFNYFTTTKGLHNLLWVFAPSAGHGNYTSKYPGSQYVDIVGLSTYGYTGGVVDGYSTMTALGKPFAITELGLQESAPPDLPLDPKDLNASIQGIKTNMPLAVWFMNWADKWAIFNQSNASEAINDLWVQNRPVPFGAILPSDPGDTILPSQVTSLSVSANGGGQATATWVKGTDAGGVTGQNIRRCTGGGRTPTTLLTR